MSDFSRYAQQISLSEIGQNGQKLIASTSFLIVGLGGLGVPVAQYLSGAGVKKIGLLDGDLISETNLHRQIAYHESDLGQLKTLTLAKHLKQLNSQVELELISEFIQEENKTKIQSIISSYDFVIDCTDNVATSLLINDLCVAESKGWIYGGIYRFDGQVAVFNHDECASYRCLFPDRSIAANSCSEVGVLGPSVAIVGSIMANEALKLALGRKDHLAGKLLHINLLNYKTSVFNIHKNPKNFEYITMPSMNILSISPLQLKSDLENNVDYFLIDVRESFEWKICHLSKAIHIPLTNLPNSLHKIPKESKIVAICHHGIRSMNALHYLKEMGYTKLINLEGGMDAYASTADPSVKRY